MTFDYLGKKRWAQIAREERLFCAELFVEIRGRVGAFVSWLNQQSRFAAAGGSLDPELPWEAAFEVCFYRDLLLAADKSVRLSAFSGKRTFDLCLFSPRDVVIIEAKAQTAFDAKQNEDFDADKNDVLAAIHEAFPEAALPRVLLLGLASSRYFENVVKYARAGAVPRLFDGHFSWRELHDSFAPNGAFLRADEVYKK
jgi:hypothetical protein